MRNGILSVGERGTVVRLKKGSASLKKYQYEFKMYFILKQTNKTIYFLILFTKETLKVLEILSYS